MLVALALIAGGSCAPSEQAAPPPPPASAPGAVAVAPPAATVAAPPAAPAASAPPPSAPAAAPPATAKRAAVAAVPAAAAAEPGDPIPPGPAPDVGPPASAPAAPAVPPPPGPRSFEPGLTENENLRPIGRDLDDFDTRGLRIRRAPEVEGRIDFDVEPLRVEPGQPYTVKVFLTNQGSKEIKLNEVGLVTFRDQGRAARSLKARTRRAKPAERVLLAELQEKGASSFWAIEVTVVSNRKDVYRNKLIWK